VAGLWGDCVALLGFTSGAHAHRHAVSGAGFFPFFGRGAIALRASAAADKPATDAHARFI